MSVSEPAVQEPTVRRTPSAFRVGVWVNVAVAAAAMVATLPGRTHGLGLITEPLIADLGVGRVEFASINLWATLIGAAFCVPCGWLLDRVGVRGVLPAVLVLLGGVVVGMSRLPAGATAALFVLILLTRGFGQSALSVVSLAVMGKAAGRTAGPAVGVYSLLVGVGFMAAFGTIKYVLENSQTDWRTLWAGIGSAVLGLAPLSWLVVRPPPPFDGEGSEDRRQTGHTLGAAVRTPVFWVFAAATSLYGMVAAGVSLFNQSILAERGFDRSVFLTVTALSPLVGLVANLATGWLSARSPMPRLLAAAMGLLAAALLAFPWVEALWQVYAYAAVMGVAGGMVTVLFFGVWGRAFGVAHLGQIQGAAQLLTVLASALGPLLLAVGYERAGSYVPVFQALAAVAGSLGFVALWVKLPDAPSEGGSA